MSDKIKSKLQKLTIKNRNPGHVSTGSNTSVLLDDVPLKGVKSLKFEVQAGDVAKVTMELFCDIEVDLDVNFNHIKESDKTIKVGDSVYVLGEFFASGIVSDKEIK